MPRAHTAALRQAALPPTAGDHISVVAEGACAFRAVLRACQALHQDTPGRRGLEQALEALAESTGAAHAALYAGGNGELPLRARVGAQRASWLPRQWQGRPFPRPAGAWLELALPGIAGREGILVLWHPRQDGLRGEASAALREGAAALGAALERRREVEQLRELCPEELLTGLLTPRRFAERLGEEACRAQRYEVSLGLLVLDVDHMGALNARHGELAGDSALSELAQLLRRQARRSDALGRCGGDELAWLLPEADLPATIRCGERLRAAIASHPFPRARRLSVSIGAASLPRAASDARELFASAEASLTLAKKAGRNRVEAASASVLH